MKLRDLLAGVPLTGGNADLNMEINSISYDSRTLEPGALFVTLSGSKTDGHRYVAQALEKGAAAILCREPPRTGSWLSTPDPRAALARVSAAWFGYPGEEMTLIGVTGTNGKTTTTYLIKAMLEGALKTRVGLIGTNRNLIGALELPAHRTTPEPYELQALLRRMADAGCTHVVMEVSSHALAQSRVEGLTFQAGVFTNLTQDHLDYHGTMEAYRRAKGRLFRQSERAVLNLDDEAGRWYRERIACPSLTYSENKDTADLTAKNIRLFPGHVEFEAGADHPGPSAHPRRLYHLQRPGGAGMRALPGHPAGQGGRPPACGAGGEGPGGGGACPHGLHRHHRLCPHAGCPGEHPYHRPGLHCGPADLCVRLRRRPGPEQAPPHGGGGRRAG